MNRTAGHPLSRALSALRLPPSRSVSAAKKVEPPFRRHRTATSVLEAIAATIPRPTMHPNLLPQDPILMKGIDTRAKDYALLLKLKGRQSARYFIKNFPEQFSVMNFEAPPIPAFRPRYHEEHLTAEPPSDEVLNGLVSICALDAAWDMHQQLGRDQVSSETRLRLLDLLCAFNSRSRPLLDTDPVEILLGKAQPGMENQLVHRQLAPPTWNFDGRAHELFNSLEGPEKGPGYCALIRGMVRYGEYEKPLQLHEEMRRLGFVGNRDSYTALLRCVHVVKFKEWKKDGATMKQWPWRAGLDLFYEMRDFNIEPDVESFNALLYSLSFSSISGSIRPQVVLKCFASVLQEMNALGIPVNLGTLTNALRLGFNLNSGYFAINKQLKADGFAPMNNPIMVNVSYTQIIQYLIDRLSEDKGRKRFGTEYDKETMYLLRRARYQFRPSFEMMLKVHRLLRSSPGLFISQRLRTYYYSSILELTMRLSPEDAIEVFENSPITAPGLREDLRLMLYKMYATHKPERLDVVLHPAIQHQVLEKRAKDNPLLHTCYGLVQSHPACRPAVIRALDFLWKRIDADRMKDVSGNVVSTALSIILPEDLAEKVDEAALNLAWSFYDLRKDDSVDLVRRLQLGISLLRSERKADGLKVLNAAVSGQRAVDKQHVQLCEKAVEKLSGMAEVISHGPLHQRLVEHASGRPIYYVSQRTVAKAPADKDGAGGDRRSNERPRRRSRKQELLKGGEVQNEEKSGKFETRDTFNGQRQMWRRRDKWVDHSRRRKGRNEKDDSSSSSSSSSSDED